MVAAVRRGESQHSVARRYGFSLSAVQRWVTRAKGQRLDRVDWSDRPSGPRQSPTRTSREMEDLVLEVRRELRDESDLGEFGAVAIHAELLARGVSEVPHVRTIGRIVERRGALDGKRRIRRKAPPAGWYLPAVAEGRAELDQTDIVEGLVIKDGPRVEVLNVVSLHGGLVGSWPQQGIKSATVREALVEHWREVGLPGYAQFDNATVFQGPHQHPDVIGSVTRLCLSLEIVPVFAPPREMGFQAAIESFNGHWQAKVWTRFEHESLAALQAQSHKYVAAHRRRSAIRREAAPERRPFPDDWSLDLQARPEGKIIYLRRTTDQGKVSLLGHDFLVDPTWPRRLVRCEVRLDEDIIHLYALRRRAPDQQPLLNKADYNLPKDRYALRR